MINAVHWVTPDNDQAGNAFGYRTHNMNMLRETSKHIEIHENGEIALHIVPADQFHPIPGKINVLFTMWEFMDLPNSYIRNIQKADHLVVPCSFCRDLFKRYTPRPIHVCWEGVDPDKYPYYERQAPNFALGEKFRWLWVGAPNPRKGYLTILEMCKIIKKHPHMEMYIKTTAAHRPREERLATLREKKDAIIKEKGVKFFYEMKKRIETDPNVANILERKGEEFQNLIFDSRVLPMDELIGLYNSAHAFILPTLGEGWGLTLCEAMATGVPITIEPGRPFRITVSPR